MPFSDITIELANGQLGAVGGVSTSVPALILTGVGTVNIPLGTPKVIFSLADAEALGIDDTSHAFAYKQIKEFYQGYQTISKSPKCELYIMLVAASVTLSDMVDASKAHAPTVLNYAKGRIRLLGVARNPSPGYTPDVTGGIDKDSLDALPLAQVLGNTWAETYQSPIRTLIEGRAFDVANIGDLVDLKQRTSNRSGIVLWGTDNSASSVGYTIGVKAALPFVRKISRVNNGSHEFTGGVFIGNAKMEDVFGLETIHNKGYIVMRTIPRKSGYYFAGENMAVKDTDDYAILSRGLVVDEAQCIAYNVFSDELEEDVDADDFGQLLAGYVSYVERKIINAISFGLAGQISGVQFSIPEGQNIVSNATTNAELGIRPKGYQTYIKLKLGFVNPASN